MTTKKATAHIECNKNGFYSVYTNDEFPFGFFGEGKTQEEAMEDFVETFKAFRDDHQKQTGEYVEAEFDFVMDISALLQEFKDIINLRALSDVTGISKVMLSQYACGTRHPKPAQRQRIINGIHEMGRKCLAVQ